MRLKVWSGALALVLSLLMGLAGAWAAPGDLYTVADVPVDATAGSAIEARDIAIANGRVAAWTQLWQRLTPQPEWGKIPALSSQQLDDMIVGINVANERRSSTRYLANITYTFNEGQVQSILRGSNASYSAAQAEPYLVIPLLVGLEGRKLWGDDNEWANAWRTVNLSGALVPMLVPSGDVEDLAVVNADNATTLGWPEYAPMAIRYEAARVLVAQAVHDGANVVVTTSALSPAGRVDQTYTITPNPMVAEDDAALFARAIGEISAKADAEWKTQTAASAGQVGDLNASVTFASLGEWGRIRQALSRTPTIQNLRISGFSAAGAAIGITYQGTPQQLQATLAAQGLALTETAGQWTLTGASQPLAPAPTGVEQQQEFPSPTTPPVTPQ
ncbi:MAG: DUF2066 domain-containing protein [Alphaproteobacteria bacterium]|nr:DUF2066 domain-containing protein [Alphaproteobacteria bacterium]